MKSLCSASILIAVLLAPSLAAQAPVVWSLSKLSFAAPVVPTVYGAPQLDRASQPASIAFNGRDDGYAISLNPVAGWSKFTIRAKIRPAAPGPEAQRFLHIEDAAGHRITMEIRLAPDGTWSLDTFLKNAPHALTLASAALRHSSGVWHVAELRYDGKIMSASVDGQKELSGPVEFVPMGPGQTAVGVRLNRVSWFKGSIAGISFEAR